LSFAASVKVKADIELQPSPAINRAFRQLEYGDVPRGVGLQF
jgi:hypothetical protein